jgi:hypothetical protein
MTTLSVWKCGSHLYGPQKLEVYLFPTRIEHEAKRWLELIKDYEIEVHYHPGKENMVADALCSYLPVVHLTGKSLAPECYWIYHCTTSPSNPS